MSRLTRPVGMTLAVLAAVPLPSDCFDGGFTDVDDDVVARFFHRAGNLESGLVLVSGGMRFQIVPPSLISLETLAFYDPADDTFSTTFAPGNGDPPLTPVLAVARSSHTQTTLADGRVLITGGRTGASGANPGTPVASVEVFDPCTGSVSAGPAMSTARAGHTATALPDGRVVVAGGSTWQVFSEGAWSSAFALDLARSNHAAVLLPDHAGEGAHRVLLVGGSGAGASAIERLDPDTGVSTLMDSSLALGVDDLVAARLDDGDVLIVGGQDVSTGDTTDLTYLYDPGADEIAPAPTPPGRADGISDHQIVTVGRFALVFGGEQQVDGVDTELDYAAAYDRAAGEWVYTATMNDPHDDFAAALLPDRRVLLIAGGVPFQNQELPSDHAEVFAAATTRPPDIDGDGAVTFNDLLRILDGWGKCPAEGDCPADLDFSGAVDFNDLLAVLDAWGPC